MRRNWWRTWTAESFTNSSLNWRFSSVEGGKKQCRNWPLRRAQCKPLKFSELIAETRHGNCDRAPYRAFHAKWPNAEKMWRESRRGPSVSRLRTGSSNLHIPRCPGSLVHSRRFFSLVWVDSSVCQYAGRRSVPCDKCRSVRIYARPASYG